MSEKTLKFSNIRVNKKEFHKSKQPIDLMSVNINQIVVSDRFKHSDKYFENGGKNLSFMVKDDNVLDKYNKIWDKIKEKLNIKFHSEPVYDETYIKVKVREFDGVVKTNFLGNELPKENMHYAFIACITIDSVMKMDKKNHPQVYLEECKYKIKKIQMTRFITAKLKSGSESGSEAESKSDTELMAKLKSDSDSE